MFADIVRYIRLKRLSSGQGHPDLVPVRGSASYPQSSRKCEAEGTGTFNSASRGGPASR